MATPHRSAAHLAGTWMIAALWAVSEAFALWRSRGRRRAAHAARTDVQWRR